MADGAPYSAQIANDLISGELSSARAFYGEDGYGATAMLPILHALHRTFGYVSPDAVPLIADRLNVSQAEVRGVISFYHDFHETPPSRHVVKLCRAEACQATGAERVAAHLAATYGLRPDATVGHVTLRSVYCLGNCALGPSALVDEALVGGFDEAHADRVITVFQASDA